MAPNVIIGRMYKMLIGRGEFKLLCLYLTIIPLYTHTFYGFNGLKTRG